MNNKYKIKIKHPLVRPGIEIETEASEKYLVNVIKKTMSLVREFNKDGSKKIEKLLEEETVKHKGKEIEAPAGAEEFLYRKGYKYTETKEIARALVVVLLEEYANFKLQEVLNSMER